MSALSRPRNIFGGVFIVAVALSLHFLSLKVHYREPREELVVQSELTSAYTRVVQNFEDSKIRVVDSLRPQTLKLQFATSLVVNTDIEAWHRRMQQQSVVVAAVKVRDRNGVEKWYKFRMPELQFGHDVVSDSEVDTLLKQENWELLSMTGQEDLP